MIDEDLQIRSKSSTSSSTGFIRRLRRSSKSMSIGKENRYRRMEPVHYEMVILLISQQQLNVQL